MSYLQRFVVYTYDISLFEHFKNIVFIVESEYLVLLLKFGSQSILFLNKHFTVKMAMMYDKISVHMKNVHCMSSNTY